MRFLFGLVLTALASTAMAQQQKFLDQLPIFDERGLVQRGVFRAKVPGFDELRAEAARFPTYEAFVRELFVMAPTLQDNFVLVHNSESQQLSSLAHPRVLLFGGGVALGLSEHPDQKDQRVEIMEVDPKTYEISLKEIVFTTAGPEFVEKPQSCQACHGSPAKPLWNPYDFWPNTFGSAIGFVGTSGEADAYARLIADRAKSPLLTALKLGPTISTDTENVTAFTQFIHQVNLGRWAHENLTGPKIDDYAEPLIAVLNYCASDANSRANPDKFAKLFHPDDRAIVLAEGPKILADVKASREHFKGYLDQMQNRIFSGGKTEFKVDHTRLADEVGVLAQMRQIFAMAGIDVRNLTTSLVSNDALISAPSNAPLDFLGAFFEARPDLFRNVKWSPLKISADVANWITVDCQQLQARAPKKRRRVAVTTWEPFTKTPDSRPLLSRCAHCHAEGLGQEFLPAPALPFGQPSELAKLLRKPDARWKERILKRVGEARGTSNQMPPGKALTDDEVGALGAYLDNLSL